MIGSSLSEVGPKGIRVVHVSPGWVVTEAVPLGPGRERRARRGNPPRELTLDATFGARARSGWRLAHVPANGSPFHTHESEPSVDGGAAER